MRRGDKKSSFVFLFLVMLDVCFTESVFTHELCYYCWNNNAHTASCTCTCACYLGREGERRGEVEEDDQGLECSLLMMKWLLCVRSDN